MRNKILRIPLVAVLTVMLCFTAFTGCALKKGEETDPVVEVLSLNTYELSMTQYTESELKAYLPEKLKGQEVAWSSSDEKKVTVAPSSADYKKAILTSIAVTNSPVKITAKCGDSKVVCNVSVVAGSTDREIVISADGETVTNETMEIGETLLLSSSFKEGGKVVEGVAITYASNDNSRVTVTPNGLVVAISRGNGVVVSANALYKGQEVTSRLIVTVKDETKNAVAFEFMKAPTGTRNSTVTAYSGDATALGFNPGTSVTSYNGVAADFGVSGAKPTHSVFNKNIVTTDDSDKLISAYDKVVFDCSFPNITLPYMNFWLGGAAIHIELPDLSGGVAVAFYNPTTQTQANTIVANTVYTCVIDLGQMDKEGKTDSFGFAFVPDLNNKTASGTMYIANAVACTDYVYANEYGFPTPSGKITKGAYLCYAEVGGYANVPSSSDITKETTGEYANWSKINYTRTCSVNHEHNGDNSTNNPICNRIMPMLPSIAKWAASLGAGGYWNYDFWGLDFVLNNKPVGVFLNSKKDTPEGDKDGVILSVRSGYRDFGITSDGYIIALNIKEGKFEGNEIEITDANGVSIISFDETAKLFKADLQIGKKYSIRVALKRSNDSYGIGVYSTDSGSWYAGNPYFEKK